MGDGRDTEFLQRTAEERQHMKSKSEGSDSIFIQPNQYDKPGAKSWYSYTVNCLNKLNILKVMTSELGPVSRQNLVLVLGLGPSFRLVVILMPINYFLK